MTAPAAGPLPPYAPPTDPHAPLDKVEQMLVRNMVAIRAEERLALAVYRPAAFGKVTGLTTVDVTP